MCPYGVLMTSVGIANLEKLMVEFAKYYQNAPSQPGYMPKANELISAKFSDGQWYRAKVRRTSPAKREAEVTFIDYGEFGVSLYSVSDRANTLTGNRDTVPFSHTRPLDGKFKSLPSQSHDARLS